MTTKANQRAVYWRIIISLIAWVACLNEQNRRYEYAGRFLRADNAWLREKVMGIPLHESRIRLADNEE